MFEKSGLTMNDVIEIIVASNLRYGDFQEARTMIILVEMLKNVLGQSKLFFGCTFRISATIFTTE